MVGYADSRLSEGPRHRAEAAGSPDVAYRGFVSSPEWGRREQPLYQ